MSIIIIRPRSVVRPPLIEPTNRQYLSVPKLAKVDAILAKEEDSWSNHEFRYLTHALGEIDEAQNP